MKLAFFIAWRYLFAKKSRQIINVISAISATGITLGTMALVVVMSVYNGFDNLVKGMYHTCLLYTSDAADELLCVDLGGRRILKKKKKQIPFPIHSFTVQPKPNCNYLLYLLTLYNHHTSLDYV